MKFLLDLFEILFLGGLWGFATYLVSVLWKEWHFKQTEKIHDVMKKYPQGGREWYRKAKFKEKRRDLYSKLYFWFVGIIIYLITVGIIFPGLYL